MKKMGYAKRNGAAQHGKENRRANHATPAAYTRMTLVNGSLHSGPWHLCLPETTGAILANAVLPAREHDVRDRLGHAHDAHEWFNLAHVAAVSAGAAGASATSSAARRSAERR